MPPGRAIDGLCGLGAAELARKIRAGAASPLEVIDAHIERIAEIEPHINALVTTAFDEARTTARRLTETGVPRDPPPLHGVPLTVKDALAVQGLPITAGSRFRRDRIAEGDAEAVRRLRAAGAIILAKSNCSDMSGAPETDNPVVGLTRNPRDLERSAGGSSGGEGAIIAAGGSPLGLGSDIAGSIRLPAAFCGVVGLKPSTGRIPTDGHVPPPPPALADWNTVGPLARRVEDVRLALDVLSASRAPGKPAPSLVDRPLLVAPAVVGSPASREVTRAVRQSANVLVAAGMSVRRTFRLPMTKTVFETTALLHLHWLPNCRTSLGGGRPVAVWRELLKAGRGRSGPVPASLAPLALLSSVGPAVRALGFGRAGRIDELRQRFRDEMRDGAVLLMPVFPTTARRHGFSLGPYGGLGCTSIFNALGFPAVAVPVGLSGAGLPLSVQVIARPGDDEVALAVAAVLEREFDGWQTALRERPQAGGAGGP